MTDCAYSFRRRGAGTCVQAALIAVLIATTTLVQADSDSNDGSVTPLAPASRYTIRPGDTLGSIAARIEGREPGTIQALADRILELNPHAFENGDPTEMRLGAVLDMPGRGDWMKRDAGRGWYTPKPQGIEPGSQYRVAAGDTLSTVAGRVTGRKSGTIEALAAEILAGNPHAFADGKPNRIRLGAMLKIPSSGNWHQAGPTSAAKDEHEDRMASSAQSRPAVAAEDARKISETTAVSPVPAGTTPPPVRPAPATMATVTDSPVPQPDAAQGARSTSAAPASTRGDKLTPATGVSAVSTTTGTGAPTQSAKAADVAATRPVTQSPGTENLYRLDSGDRVRVTVYGHEDLSGDFDIDGAGRLSLPLVESVMARGVSINQLVAAIVDMLRPDYLRNPRVSVEVLNYRPFYIMGEVNEPGSYPYVEGMTVLNAIAVAGGYTYRARKNKIRVTRGAAEKQESRIVETGTRVLPGDVIEIPERFF